MTNIQPEIDAVDYVRSDFISRQRRNPKYSLRAYAKHLGINAGRLSEYLSRKRDISYKAASLIADALCLSPDEKINFIHSAVGTPNSRMKNSEDSKTSTYDLLAMDRFEVISQWYYFAILNLINTKGFKNEEKWIADRLNLHPLVVRDAIARLTRLGMIKVNKSQKLERTNSNWYVGNNLPSTALRALHAASLEKDIESLQSVDMTLRDITSIIFPANTKKLAAAKELTRDFQRKIAKLMDDGPTKSEEVYRLGIQLVPLSRT